MKPMTDLEYAEAGVLVCPVCRHKLDETPFDGPPDYADAFPGGDDISDGAPSTHAIAFDGECSRCGASYAARYKLVDYSLSSDPGPPWWRCSHCEEVFEQALPAWLDEDTEMAFGEGWGLFNPGEEPEIQRLDGPSSATDDSTTNIEPAPPRFEDDVAAVGFVRKLAASGSDLHARAMALAFGARCPACGHRQSSMSTPTGGG